MHNKGICPFLLGFVLFGLTVTVSADFSKPSKNISNDYWGWDKTADIAVVPGTDKVFALWTRLDSDLERPTVKFSKSNDGGVIWSSPISLNCTDPWWWYNPNYWEIWGAAMAVDDPYIHVVMSFSKTLSGDYQISYRRSVDLGETWEPWVRLTNSSSPSVSPDVAAGGGYVHIAYLATWPGNWEVMYKRIAANGSGPVDQTRRLTFSTGSSSDPTLAISKDGSVVNIVYQDDTSGIDQIMHKRLLNSGAGVMETRSLTFGGHDKYGPSIATSSGADDQYVFIVYSERADPAQYRDEVMFKRLDQFGAPGAQVLTARLTSTQISAYPSSIAFDGSTNAVYVAYIAWPMGYADVLYKKLADYGGGSFTTGRISYGEGASYGACMGAADGWAYVIWDDDALGDGIPDIFFKRGN
jgi:hypothetical protein